MEILTQPQAESLLSEITALRSDVGALTERLNAVLASVPGIAADASAADIARRNGQQRGFFWAREFAAVIGHHSHYVTTRCACRVIKTLKGGKPYRIPLDEEARWNTVLR